MARVYDDKWKRKVSQGVKKAFENLSEDARKRMSENGKAQSFRLTHRKKPFEQLKGWKSIRHRIFEERGRKCEECGWAEINPFNGMIPVQIDHLDGDHTNNKKENLKIKCPNHHSLTEFFMFYGRHHK